MIKPDWDIFKAKFSNNPQAYFEWLCYILFCIEFHKGRGIFRFKNQSSVETNPIKKDNEVIGWQAKFYSSALSNHKAEIITTIETAKRTYPEVTRIILYTNQEWGQYRGKYPRGLAEIEAKSKDLNLEIDWRIASFFESPFVCIENKIVIKHFFSFNNSVFNLIEELQEHTINILKEIQTSFIFKGQTFNIDRGDLIRQIRNAITPVIILSGIAGVGKTVIVKKYFEDLGKDIPFYVFKATEFNNLRNINDFFRGISLNEFISAHNENEKIVVIDSAEKILDLTNTDPLKEFLSVLIEKKWEIIFTTRNNFIKV